MKKSLKLLVTVLALGVMTSVPALRAQDGQISPAEGGGKKGGKGGGRQMPSPAQQVERIEQAVGTLSAEQKTKITEIITKSRSDMEALPREERRGKGMEIMKAQRDAIRAVLTADQQKKFDDMPAPGGPGGPGGKKRGGGEGTN
jgi:Spy/CpxP family protein refolding chaperone